MLFNVLYRCVSLMWVLIIFDFNSLLFRGWSFNIFRVWIVFGFFVAVLCVVCYLFAEAVVDVAALLEVHIYFTVLILVAIVMFILDTILSVKDVLKG